MGYHHCHIPDLNTLVTQLREWGVDKFVTKYKKCQTLIGDNDAVRFIEDVIELFEKNKS